MSQVVESPKPTAKRILKTKSLPPEPEAIVSVRGLTKSYHKNRIEVPVLRGVDFDIMPGRLTTLVGRSGSGKSTLMHLLATLDQPDAGEVYFEGKRIDNAPARQRDRYRNHEIGMIFQFYHLLPELSALENVMIPTMISRGLSTFWSLRRTARKRAEELLRLVDLEHRMTHRPAEMSGGEMQRAAIARALMNDPKVLFADEPTGNLDSETGSGIVELLHRLNQENGLTIVMITHDDDLAQQGDHVVRLVNGAIVDAEIEQRVAG